MRQSKTFVSLVCVLATSQPAVVLGFFLQKPQPPSVKPKLQELNELVEQAQNGVDESFKPQVIDLMVDIGASSGRKDDQRKKLPGKWELIYTTEKEVNFFKTSWPFATVSSITQSIDPFGSETISNSINFSGGGKFVVDGSVVPIDEADSPYDRVGFQFKTAEIFAWGKSISIPPAGSGWFDTIYCDNEYRLSTDVRGDWSVFKRMQ
jgi:hypothetical protein